jgi:trehalose synthase
MSVAEALKCVSTGQFASDFSVGTEEPCCDKRIGEMWKGWSKQRRCDPMPEMVTAIEPRTLGLHSLESYEPLIGPECVDRILRKVQNVRDLHVIHVSSTFYGGGVTEILTPFTLIMNAQGIETGWRMIQGTPPFFSFTKKLHNALQGEEIDLTQEEIAVYEQIMLENATRLHIEDCDAVVVHDPQPLGLIAHFPERDTPWLWQCHVDLSSPHAGTWTYLRKFIDQYHTAIFSLPEYRQALPNDQRFIMPAINPFSPKNCEMSEEQSRACLVQHRIPLDRPLVVQISRFDRFKDPVGVIDAFRKARKEVDCTLILLGSPALDDPEADVILETIRASVDESIIIMTVEDAALVNALQRQAAVVLQKSTREGFGLTVTEAMWKGAAVIGGNVGGIKRQIQDGKNGFLVDTVDQAADRIVQILKDPELRQRLGARARETVRENSLMSRLAEDWIDLLSDVRAAEG